MPTFKKSKEERGLYNDDMLNEAVNLVVNGNMSVRQAAKTCGINRTTLGRYVKEASKSDSGLVSKHSICTPVQITTRIMFLHFI